MAGPAMASPASKAAAPQAYLNIASPPSALLLRRRRALFHGLAERQAGRLATLPAACRSSAIPAGNHGMSPPRQHDTSHQATPVRMAARGGDARRGRAVNG